MGKDSVARRSYTFAQGVSNAFATPSHTEFAWGYLILLWAFGPPNAKTPPSMNPAGRSILRWAWLGLYGFLILFLFLFDWKAQVVQEFRRFVIDRPDCTGQKLPH